MDKRKKRPVRVFIDSRYLAWLLRESVERYQAESTEGNILVVDDEVNLLHVLEEGLEAYCEGSSVLTAKDGIIARQKLKENAVSLVVTNLRMPGIDGFELLDYIKVNYPDIPVIILSGYHGLEKSKLSRDKGAVAYFRKPCRIEDLVRTVRYFSK